MMSQMLTGLLLQFSALCFCFSKTGEKEPKNQGGVTGEDSILVGRPAAAASPSTGASLAVMCYKKLI
jgi:hypothetical protein